VSFVLPAKRSLFVGFAAVTLYCANVIFINCYVLPNIFGEYSFGSALPTNLIIMVITVGIAIRAKLTIDRSKFSLFRLLEIQKGEIVNEKILRCQAEFAKDALLDNVARQSDMVSLAGKSAAVVSLPAQSVASAPSCAAFSSPAILMSTRGTASEKFSGMSNGRLFACQCQGLERELQVAAVFAGCR
jgi:hypothetical protein